MKKFLAIFLVIGLGMINFTSDEISTFGYLSSPFQTQGDTTSLKNLPSRIIEIVKMAPYIQVYAFDIGGTLADEKEDIPSSELIQDLATLLNAGKHVVIISGKAEKTFKPWIEDKLMPLVGKDKRLLFMAYGDRVTKTYQGKEDGVIEVVSTIAFPHPKKMKEIAEVSKKVADEFGEEVFKVKTRDAYIQVAADEDLPSSQDEIRKRLQKRLVAELEKTGLLLRGIAVELQGKKGAYILSDRANKSGAIRNLMDRLNLRPNQVAYVADQFAGKSTADLSVVGTGVYNINVGPDEDHGHDNIYNFSGGPSTTRVFVQVVVGYLKRAETNQPQLAPATSVEQPTTAVLIAL